MIGFLAFVFLLGEPVDIVAKTYPTQAACLKSLDALAAKVERGTQGKDVIILGHKIDPLSLIELKCVEIGRKA